MVGFGLMKCLTAMYICRSKFKGFLWKNITAKNVLMCVIVVLLKTADIDV